MSIPRTFHRIWFSTDGSLEPARFARFWRWLQELHPDWTFRMWNNDDDYSWLRNRDLFEKADLFGKRPDILRYEILHRYGGFYIDMDVEPLRSFEPLTKEDCFIVGAETERYEHVVGKRDVLELAWETGTAVVACPPKHPAADALIANLPEWMATHVGAGTPYETGPGYASAQLIKRNDVLVLPSNAFYPVLWNRMPDLHPPYPEESYAVHHWASLWRPHGARAAIHTSDISLLVPFTSEEPARVRAWEWLRSYWETYLPEAEIVVGEYDNTPYNKAAALNDAARRAENYYLVTIDADTFIPAHVVRRCVQQIGRSKIPLWYVPFTRWTTLTEEASDSVLSSDRLPDWSLLEPEVTYSGLNGSCMVMTRKAWDAVHGYDERAVGWCGEDQMMIHSLDTMYGKHSTVEGDSVSLWHPRTGKGASQRWSGQRESHGQALLERYRDANGDRKKMRALIQERNEE